MKNNLVYKIKPTMQSALVIYMAIVFMSTLNRTSFTFFSMLVSRGLFSGGNNGDWYIQGLKQETVSMVKGIK